MDKIKELEEKVRNSSGEEKVRYLNDLAFSFYNHDPEKTEKYAMEALSLGVELNASEQIARSYNNIGISFHIRGDYKKALQYYHKALSAFKQLDLDHKVAGVKNNIGGIYEKQGDFEKALRYYLKALKLWEQADEKHYTAATYNNIGIIYEKQGMYDEALHYHQKSLKIKEDIGDERNIAISLSNIGVVYERQNKSELALEYHQKALAIKEKLGDQRSIAISFHNIANILLSQEQYDTALEYCQKASKIFTDINESYGQITSLTSLGIVLEKLGKFTEAEKQLKKSLDMAREIKAKELEMNSLNYLSDLFENQKDYEQALHYQREYSVLKEEIFSEKKSKQIAEMRTKYETDQKEKEAEIYRLKNVELATANEMVNIKNRKLENRENQLKLVNKILRHDLINNLSVIDAALKLYRTDHDENLFVEATAKVKKSIALINKLRVREDEVTSEDLKLIDFNEIINRIIKHYPEIEFTVVGHGNILADDAIDSVIDNIINNADMHGETSKIDISIASEKSMSTIKIADQGKGIPDEVKDKIFNEGFIYGDKGNTGVGLYIVREYLKQWGGSITVMDNKPKGIVFTLTLRNS
ncbi:MAG: tetratricopeptide repeat-containing sensor histidine kinase [Candidatus Cloacimonetes bacterium]|nr:tetratricopeptide repeat-containing sensor histidine kinase [Candidatus Cloacimonadota bacterium]